MSAFTFSSALSTLTLPGEQEEIGKQLTLCRHQGLEGSLGSGKVRGAGPQRSPTLLASPLQRCGTQHRQVLSLAPGQTRTLWDTSACCRAYPFHVPRWVPGTGNLWLQDSKGDAALPFHHSLQTASQPDHSVCNGVMCTSVILGRIRTVVVSCTEKGRPSSTSVASRGCYGSLTIL